MSRVTTSKPPIPFYIVRKVLDGLLKMAVNLQVEGIENIPQNQQYILVGNHLNWSDPFFLYTIMPAAPKLVFVAETEGVYNNWWKRTFINLVGKPIVPIQRDNPRSRVGTMKAMFRILKSGHNLGVFPEGRIGHKEGDLFPFHIGAFAAARKLKIPILPVALAGTHALAKDKPVHFKIGRLAFCKPEEDEEDFARRMALLIKNMIPAYPGDGPTPEKWSWMTNLLQGELRPFEGERDLIIRVRKKKTSQSN